jgi:hypothetical protein
MLFAFCISFASVAAEPALMAVAYKAEAVSGGSMRALTLRMVAALGKRSVNGDQVLHAADLAADDDLVRRQTRAPC